MTRVELAAGMTIAAARRRLADALRGQSFDTPDLDARVLIAHALDLDHAGLIRDSGRTLTSEEIEAIAAVAARRLQREPVARIVGIKEFWSLPLSVNAATLVPRPETETVVEAALAAVDTRGGRSQALRLLDIGTGSGALLLALLAELPNAFGVGTDVSIDALAVARGNAVRLGLTQRAGFLACNIAAALRGPFDLVVSNPPYVAHATIAAQVPQVMARQGRLVVELGAGQGESVAAVLRGCGLTVQALTRDIYGHARALTAVGA